MPPARPRPSRSMCMSRVLLAAASASMTIGCACLAASVKAPLAQTRRFRATSRVSQLLRPQPSGLPPILQAASHNRSRADLHCSSSPNRSRAVNHGGPDWLGSEQHGAGPSKAVLSADEAIDLRMAGLGRIVDNAPRSALGSTDRHWDRAYRFGSPGAGRDGSARSRHSQRTSQLGWGFYVPQPPARSISVGSRKRSIRGSAPHG